MNPRLKVQFAYTTPTKFQIGFSLIEILVAMAITLLITAGVATLFANTVFSTKTLNSATAINEESIRINTLLARHVRMSGYVDWLSQASLFNGITSNEATNSSSYNLKTANQTSMFQRAFATSQIPATNIPLPLFGCDAGYINPRNASFTTTNTCQASSNTPNTAALTVAYQVNSKPEASFSAILPTTFIGDSTRTSGDCLGQAVNTTLYTTNRFYLAPSTTATTQANEPVIYDLMCLGRGSSTPQVLASNIEQWVIKYGIPNNSATPNTSTSNDMQVAQYLTAEEVTNKNAWNQVMAVRSCFLIVGERGSATISGIPSVGMPNRLDCLGYKMKVGTELRLRQSFTQTILLRNQIHTSNLTN
jgi:type IV pilus assembly protein PilW